MKLEILEKDHFYHIYNRGINACNIFENDENYNYFLRLFSKYLNKHISLYAYCLMSNHYHFVFRVDNDGNTVTQQLSNLFNAYAKGFNKQQGRTGSLFEKHFKRIRLQSETYLRNLIVYVHMNPVKHGITEDFKDYNFSSYKEMIYDTSSMINSKEVIELFNDSENFKYVHEYKKDVLSIKYALEL